MSLLEFLLVLATGAWLGFWLGPAITRWLQAQHRRRLKPRLLLRVDDADSGRASAPPPRPPEAP
jgi:hypothetical protein